MILMILILAVSFGCGKWDKYSDFREVYNVDYRFYFYIQPQYGDSLTTLGNSESSETLIVRYTRDAYALVTAYDLYDDLEYEDIAGLTKEQFTIGDPAMDDTFNDRTYIQNYFQEYLSNSGSYKDIARVRQVEINDHIFWFCHVYFYDSDPTASNVNTGENFNGEGYLYYTIYDGVTYFINITSSDCFIADTPEAEEFMQNFFIGIRTRPVIYVFWSAAAVIAVAVIIGMFSMFLQLHVEPAVIIEVIRSTLSKLMRGQYRSVHDLDSDLENIEVDRVLGRVDYDVKPEDQKYESDLRVLLSLDEILGRIEPGSLTELDQGDFVPTESAPAGPAVTRDLPSSEVLTGLRRIYAGEYNEEEEKTVLSLTDELDVILGRRSAGPEVAYTPVPEPDSFGLRMVRMSQRMGENASARRAASEEARDRRIQEKNLRQAEKAAAEAEKREAETERKYSALYSDLDRRFEAESFPTRVYDLIPQPSGTDEILHNLDTIFVRTLTSKLDAILERTVWTSRAVTGGTYEEDLSARNDALLRESARRRELDSMFAGRIAHPQGFHSDYSHGEISSPAGSESTVSLEKIHSGELAPAYTEEAPAREYTERNFAGPGAFVAYQKVERGLHGIADGLRKLFSKKDRSAEKTSEELLSEAMEAASSVPGFSDADAASEAAEDTRADTSSAPSYETASETEEVNEVITEPEEPDFVPDIPMEVGEAEYSLYMDETAEALEEAAEDPAEKAMEEFSGEEDAESSEDAPSYVPDVPMDLGEAEYSLYMDQTAEALEEAEEEPAEKAMEEFSVEEKEESSEEDAPSYVPDVPMDLGEAEYSLYMDQTAEAIEEAEESAASEPADEPSEPEPPERVLSWETVGDEEETGPEETAAQTCNEQELTAEEEKTEDTSSDEVSEETSEETTEETTEEKDGESLTGEEPEKKDDMKDFFSFVRNKEKK